MALSMKGRPKLLFLVVLIRLSKIKNVIAFFSFEPFYKKKWGKFFSVSGGQGENWYYG